MKTLDAPVPDRLLSRIGRTLTPDVARELAHRRFDRHLRATRKPA